jgi:hypothetical protein
LNDIFIDQITCFAKEGIIFLILSAPELQGANGRVSQLEPIGVNVSTGRFHQFLEHVAIATSSLVMDAADGVAMGQLQAGTNHSVQFLLHLGVTSLNSSKVELGAIVALDLKVYFAKNPFDCFLILFLCSTYKSWCKIT